MVMKVVVKVVIKMKVVMEGGVEGSDEGGGECGGCKVVGCGKNYVSLMVVRFNDSESLGTDVGDCRVAFATEDFV